MTKSQLIPMNGIIEIPGHYYLKNDRITRGKYNIRIECSHVSIDLNRRSLQTIPEDPNKDYFGIYAPNLSNIHIYGGTIEGATVGIQALCAQKLHAEHLIFQQCRYMGINFGGSDSHIHHCEFVSIGGSDRESYSVGINTSDAENPLIENNHFYEIYRNGCRSMHGEGVAILLGHDTFNAHIKNNLCTNEEIQKNTFGIWAMGENHYIQSNIIQNFQKGIVMSHSLAEDNILVLKRQDSKAVGISGIKSISKKNILVNYQDSYGEKDPGYKAEDEKIFQLEDLVF